MANGQPSNMEPYLQSSNPVTRDPLEEKVTKHLERHDHPSSHLTAHQKEQRPGAEGIPSSLGRGVTSGSGPVDAQEAQATRRGAGQEEPQNENVNADHALATLGEGEVADAHQRKSGTQRVPGQGPAEEQDFASDLDRKKAEQAAAREEIKEARRSGANVDGSTTGRSLGDETLRDA